MTQPAGPVDDPGRSSGAGSEPSGAAALEEQLPYRIVRPYRVRFEEATTGETARTAIYLAWAADVAWQHSTLIGFGRDWYTSRGLFWLVRSVRLEVLAPVPTYGEAFMSTQVVGYRRIAAHRRSEIYDASGSVLGRLEIDWVMTNERGVPCRVPEEMMRFVSDSASSFELFKVELPATPPDAVEQRVRVHRRDLDPLDHVNNSVYLDYFEDALDAAGQGVVLQMPRRYEIDFVAAAARDDRLIGRTWPHEGGRAYRLSREDGTELFRARVDPI
jgi:acyl-CoA thioesterase FadM